MNLIKLHLLAGGDDGVGAREIIEGTLLAKHVAAPKMSHNKILVLLRVKEGSILENISYRFSFVHHFANSPENQVEVVIHFIGFLNLEAPRHNLLLKVHLKLLDDPPGEYAQRRNILHKKVDLLLALSGLLVPKYLKATPLIYLEYVTFIGHHLRTINPSLIKALLPEPKILIDLHKLLKLHLVVALSRQARCSHNLICAV